MDYNTLLETIFEIVGHTKEEMEDLKLLFYSGMVDELMKSDNFRKNMKVFTHITSNTESDQLTLIELRENAKVFGLEKEVDKAFFDYLEKYTQHVKPTLSNDQWDRIKSLL